MRTENVQRLREYVIVDDTSVHREGTHQEYDVTTAKEDVPNLFLELYEIINW